MTRQNFGLIDIAVSKKNIFFLTVPRCTLTKTGFAVDYIRTLPASHCTHTHSQQYFKYFSWSVQLCNSDASGMI